MKILKKNKKYNKKYNRGFTLIEMIIFIVILGISSVAMLMAFQLLLQRSPTANYQTTAIGLAQERMELILAQKKTKGYASVSDPCQQVPPPSLCTFSNDYTVSSNISAFTFANDSHYKIITVTVTGAGNATLTALVGS